jgi:7-dehydrocholesterol reductase
MARSKSPARRAAKSPGRTSGKNTVATEATWESTEGEGVWGCYVAPLLLLLPCPVLCYVLAYISSLKEPTLTAFKAEIDKEGLMVVLNKCFEACGMGDEKAWCFLFVFCFTSLLVYWWPGKVEYGPITPNGHIPEYMDNGVTHCVIFTTLFLAGSKEVNPLGPEYGWYNITIIWDTFNKTIGALNIFGLVFCLFLYYKGLHFPSGPDSGTNGKGFIFDYYWGAELYPRIFNVDVKKFVNDRFSMTYWMLAGISFAYKSKELHGVWDWGIIFCAASQFIYLFKFFWCVSFNFCPSDPCLCG